MGKRLLESWSQNLCGHGSKLNHQGTAGFGPCFHLLGFNLGYLFLTHSHVALASQNAWEVVVTWKWVEESRWPSLQAAKERVVSGLCCSLVARAFANT